MSSVSGAHRDSRIDGLEGLARDGVRVLGVDSVIDDIDGSVSEGPMGEGPGKGGRTDLIDLAGETGNSDATREGLGTDSGSRMFLALVIVDIDGVLSMSEVSMSEGELVEGEIPG